MDILINIVNNTAVVVSDVINRSVQIRKEMKKMGQ